MKLFSPSSFLSRIVNYEIPKENKELKSFSLNLDYSFEKKFLYRIPCTLYLNSELLEKLNIQKAYHESSIRFDNSTNILWITKNLLDEIKASGKLNISGTFIGLRNNIPDFIKIEEKYFNMPIPCFPKLSFSMGNYSIIRTPIYSRFSYDDINYKIYLTNLPYEYYSQTIPSKSCCLIFDFQSMQYTMGINDIYSTTYLFEHFESIALDGLKFPTISSLLDKGNLFNLDSQKRTMLAKILRIPTIPSFVIQSDFRDNDLDNIKIEKDLSDLANRVLNPYFIL